MTDPTDIDAIAAQLGRVPRGIHEIGHRCPCSLPDVVTTEPRLPNGTPFPTTYYMTCPRATSRISTLESNGVMKEMEARLGTDPELAAAYAKAHESYLAARNEIGDACGHDVPEIEGISAGGMPTRVKCLHVLAGQSLAQGRGVNPLGDEVLDTLGSWWESGCCVEVVPGAAAELQAIDAAKDAAAAARAAAKAQAKAEKAAAAAAAEGAS